MHVLKTIRNSCSEADAESYFALSDQESLLRKGSGCCKAEDAQNVTFILLRNHRRRSLAHFQENVNLPHLKYVLELHRSGLLWQTD